MSLCYPGTIRWRPGDSQSLHDYVPVYLSIENNNNRRGPWQYRCEPRRQRGKPVLAVAEYFESVGLSSSRYSPGLCQNNQVSSRLLTLNAGSFKLTTVEPWWCHGLSGVAPVLLGFDISPGLPWCVLIVLRSK